MRRFVATLVTIAAFAAPVVLSAAPASAAKAGQLCKAADEGKTQDGVKCKKDGTRFRWAGGAAATTKAPTSTKAPATTKAPAKTATTKATTSTKATTNTKIAGTTKKSSSTPATTGGGVAVKGRFCAKADDGRKETDAKGRKLTCKADAAGKNRWQE